MTFGFIIDSAVLGFGLAMDAFSVSLANGLNEPHMKKSKMAGIALCFSAFQFVMPMLGWLFVHTAVTVFGKVAPYIPWVALVLLFIIGTKSIVEGIRGDDDEEYRALSVSALLVQGVATSIDALSVGFTTAEYGLGDALCDAGVIGLVTFVICFAGVAIGKKFGTKISDKASILGGLILIAIGIKICIESVI